MKHREVVIPEWHSPGEKTETIQRNGDCTAPQIFQETAATDSAGRCLRPGHGTTSSGMEVEAAWAHRAAGGETQIGSLHSLKL